MVPLSCVAATVRRGVFRHDEGLQTVALRVERAVGELQRRVRWQNAICCCSNDSEENRCCGGRWAWGRRGVFHPADAIFLCGFVLTVMWVLIDAIADVDGFAGLTRESAVAVSLLAGSVVLLGLSVPGGCGRKATKRLSFGAECSCSPASWRRAWSSNAGHHAGGALGGDHRETHQHSRPCLRWRCSSARSLQPSLGS